MSLSKVNEKQNSVFKTGNTIVKFICLNSQIGVVNGTGNFQTLREGENHGLFLCELAPRYFQLACSVVTPRCQSVSVNAGSSSKMLRCHLTLYKNGTF